MILPLTEHFVRDGGLPNLQRLLDEGSVSEAISSWPAWTPTNWATIATGSDVGAHGVYGWEVPLDGGEVLTSFHSGAIRAETLWEAAERQGIRTGLIHFPASWPSRLSKGVVIDGCASPGYGESPFEIAPGRAYVTVKGLPLCDLIELGSADGWTGLPDGGPPPLSGVIEIRGKDGHGALEVPFVLLGSGGAYDRAVFSLTRDASSPLSVAPSAEWSDWCTVLIGEAEGTTRFRLVECDPTQGRVRIWRSQVLPVTGLGEPQDIVAHLVSRFGPFQEHVSELISLGGAADYATMADEARYQLRWMVAAGLELLDRFACRLFACHWHWLDWVNHLHLGHVDPAWSRYEPAGKDAHEEVIRDALSMIDEAVGVLRASLGPDDVLVLVSDHGNLPVERLINMRQFLIERGHLVLRESDGDFSEGNIDWTRSELYVPDRLYEPNLFVNPQRTPDERKAIVDTIVQELRTWVDPDTGRTPIAIALPREHASWLGYFGPDAGDVLVVPDGGYNFALEEVFDEEITEALEGQPEPKPQGPVFSHQGFESAGHGVTLPTYATQISSHLAVLVMAGGPITPAYRRSTGLGVPHLKDVAPTVAHLLGIQAPRHSSGAVLQDFVGLPPGSMERRVEGEATRVASAADGSDGQKGMHDFSFLRVEGDAGQG